MNIPSSTECLHRLEFSASFDVSLVVILGRGWQQYDDAAKLLKQQEL